jgi:5'-methylthioadenosine phosphorylase
MNAEIAVIGGVGFDLDGSEEVVETPYGNVKVWLTRMKGRQVVFLPRHGQGHLPPHRVNYRANLWALMRTGATRVISTNAVGTMSYHPVGSFFIPLDFVEFTRTRPNTFFEERAVHIDVSQPYCPALRSCLHEAIRSLGSESFEGVYVCTEGPHLESPAQIRMIRQFGEVVGMTGYPEVVLAKELSLCYASLCIVTNPASGMKAGELTIAEVVEQMDMCSQAVREAISSAVERIPRDRTCSCKDSLKEAEIG